MQEDFVRNYALSNHTFEGEEEDCFVARLINTYMRGKRVLDLGCGPVAPVLSVFYQDAEEVVAVDKLQANLDFIEHNSDELQSQIARAQRYKEQHLSGGRIDPRLTLVQGDVTEKLDIGLFDSVMNMGCFGALNTREEFNRAVRHAYEYLKPGGTLLMANWVGEVDRPHDFNGKVHEPDVFRPSMERAGFKIEELHLEEKALSDATREMGYHAIIWAVAKK